jgi:hypothetical protein
MSSLSLLLDNNNLRSCTFSGQLKTFRNNTNKEINKRMKKFTADIQKQIQAGTIEAKPTVPSNWKPKYFAPAYGFNDFVYFDKFQKMIDSVTNAS